MVFVDDYNAWITGDSAEENTEAIQRLVIPRVRKWEKEGGAKLEAERTQFIHFTRGAARALLPWPPLHVNGALITPTPSVKVLGVNLDGQLRMSEHYRYAAKKATKQTVALGSLQVLRPQAMRHLHLSTVVTLQVRLLDCRWRGLSLIAPIIFQFGESTFRSRISAGNSRHLSPLCSSEVLTILIGIYSDDIEDITIFLLVRTITVKDGVAARRGRPLSFGGKRALVGSRYSYGNQHRSHL